GAATVLLWIHHQQNFFLRIYTFSFRTHPSVFSRCVCWKRAQNFLTITCESLSKFCAKVPRVCVLCIAGKTNNLVHCRLAILCGAPAHHRDGNCKSQKCSKDHCAIIPRFAGKVVGFLTRGGGPLIRDPNGRAENAFA